MRQIRLDTDIQPLSYFRAKTSHLIKKLREERRPLVLTQHGKGVAVILDVRDYES